MFDLYNSMLIYGYLSTFEFKLFITKRISVIVSNVVNFFGSIDICIFLTLYNIIVLLSHLMFLYYS